MNYHIVTHDHVNLVTTSIGSGTISECRSTFTSLHLQIKHVLPIVNTLWEVELRADNRVGLDECYSIIITDGSGALQSEVRIITRDMWDHACDNNCTEN